jgi:MFS family permease
MSLAARLVLFLTVTSALAALLPLIARERLHAGAGLFGVLATAGGVGAVVALGVLPRVRRRLSADRVVLLGAVAWCGGAALLATTSSVAVACVGLAFTGGASMTTMTSIFTVYQSDLPTWVRGRASSVVMLVVWLGASVGSVGWGVLGSRVGLESTLLVAAAANLVVSMLASKVLPIGDAPPSDLTPVHWAMPQLKFEPSPADGPVMVSIEWQIDPERAAEFAGAMAALGRLRRRDGAIEWRLFHDLEHPGRMVESFIVATWGEHERQHHRTVAEDAAIERPARAMLIAGDPVVSHLLAQSPPHELS